ncbi:hypothetical protein XENOCAPTIV_024532, partial [Xenoophorus captivus]
VASLFAEFFRDLDIVPRIPVTRSTRYLDLKNSVSFLCNGLTEPVLIFVDILSVTVEEDNCCGCNVLAIRRHFLDRDLKQVHVVYTSCHDAVSNLASRP